MGGELVDEGGTGKREGRRRERERERENYTLPPKLKIRVQSVTKIKPCIIAFEISLLDFTFINIQIYSLSHRYTPS